MKVFFKRLFRQEVPQKEWGTLKGTHHMKRIIRWPTLLCAHATALIGILTSEVLKVAKRE